MSIPEQLARTRRFTAGAPSRITISPDGRTIFFLRSGGLWSLTGATERLVADGVDTFAAEAGVLVFTREGRLWTVRQAVEEIPTPGPVTDPRPDPTGRRIAYVLDGALHVDGEAVAVPDGPDVTYGLPEYVAAASMGRDRGHWWAPTARDCSSRGWTTPRSSGGTSRTRPTRRARRGPSGTPPRGPRAPAAAPGRLPAAGTRAHGPRFFAHLIEIPVGWLAWTPTERRRSG